MFIVLCAVDNVGATIGRPCSRMFRIRIGFRRIRNIVPPGGGSPPLHSKSEQNDKLKFEVDK